MSTVDDEDDEDDDRFLAELGAAMRAAQEVPAGFVQAGKAAFAWHDLDAELARLVSDSASDPASGPAPGPVGAGLRSPSAAVRSLAFAAPGLTVELDLHADAVRGQVAPAGPGTVQLRTGTGTSTSTDFPIDELGWFVAGPRPAGPFRLSIRLDAGPAAVTDWIVP